MEHLLNMVSTSPKALSIHPIPLGHSQKLHLSSMATTTIDELDHPTAHA
jgi:hypothetical protein